MESVLRNNIFRVLISFVFILAFNLKSYAFETYYRDDKISEISKGVELIYSKRLTNNGLLDIHVTKIDLNNDDIEISNVFDRENSGAKKTLSELISNEEDTVCAINGDFFEIGLSPSFALGPTINNGEIEKLTAGEYYNEYSNSLATFFTREDNNPFIDYIKPVVTFKNDKDTLYLTYINKIGNKEGTTYLSGEYYSSSKDMDARNPNTYKIVVRDDEITDIIEPKRESIDIKEDEYVIFIPENFNRANNFEIGDEVEYETTLNISDVPNMAIGGASKILDKGTIVDTGYIVQGRRARSAVGFSKDKETLYLVVISSATGSVGASHYELGEILLDLGAYEAMHLDGGGSSTLMAKSSYLNKVSLVNKLYSQRAIMNGLVIKNTSSTGRLDGIKLVLEDDKVIKNTSVKYSVYGYDENRKEVKLDLDDVSIKGDNIETDYKNNKIRFKNEGRTKVTAEYKSFESSQNIDVFDSLIEIIILPDPINLLEDEKVELKIYGITEEKERIVIDPKECDYEVTKNLATVKDGMVIGNKEGAGVIKVKFNDLSAHSLIVVGENKEELEDFDSDIEVKSTSYPDYVETDSYIHRRKLFIEYEFYEKEETQAAYAEFTNPILLPKNTNKISLDVCGDRKGNVLKARLVDDKGTYYNMELCENMDFGLTKTVTGKVPSDIEGDVYLDRIYVVTLSSMSHYKSEIEIDNITAHFPIDGSEVEIPDSVTKEGSVNSKNIINIEDNDLVFYNNGGYKNLLNNYITKHVLEKLEDEKLKNSEIFISNELKNDINLNNENNYNLVSQNGLTKDFGNTKVIDLKTKDGSIFAYDPYQFANLLKNLESLKWDDDANKNVIITIKGNLFKSGRLRDKLSLEYILNKYYEKEKVNFYVVMFDDADSKETIEDGIRYLSVDANPKEIDTKNILIFRNASSVLSYNYISFSEVLALESSNEKGEVNNEE